MIRISLSYFYDLGATLRTVSAIQADAKLSDVWSVLFKAQNEVNDLLNTNWFSPAVKTANVTGHKLVNSLKEITDRSDFNSQISYLDAYNVTSALNEFQTILRADLVIADAYFVTKKAGYDTTTLIFNPEALFPNDLGVKIVAAIPDIREAGKCLAFELNTAAGFHILRATETVVREYWTVVSGGKPHPRLKTIGTYAKQMDEKKFGKSKVIATLKQIADLHRNPLIHPDETLTAEDAISLFGICHSAISFMLKEIPQPTNTILPTAP